MAKPADSGRPALLSSILELLAPFPGRLEFAVRLALICALTALVVEIYQTPDPALTVYLAFFVLKPDRTTSVAVSLILVVVISVVVGLALLIAMAVADDAMWRVIAMTLFSFCSLFLASGSKLKPVGAIIALIVGYAMDLLGSIQIGEIATRVLLYAWLFVSIPAGVSIAVNLLLGPAPARLIEQSLAHRLRLCSAVLRGADEEAEEAFVESLREGPGELPALVKAVGLERTLPKRAVAALRQAVTSCTVLESLIDLCRRHSGLLKAPDRERVALHLDRITEVLERGADLSDIEFVPIAEDVGSTPQSAALIAELNRTLVKFAAPLPPDASAKRETEGGADFFLPDAFTNPVHVHYAIKTTAAAMFSYIVFQLLDWPGIHTSMITCYIVSLGTTAETMEKLTLRIIGCLIGAGSGLAAIVYLMPNVTSIGGLMTVVFAAAVVSGWVAAGGPRIAYAGYQLAFAFFLCVVQGSAPAFDLTVARDRIIGVLLGNLVVSLIFTNLWPVSVTERIAPGLAGVVRRLADLALARTHAQRWRLTEETRVALAEVEQDLDLAAYEPSWIRPGRAWLDLRRRSLDVAGSLLGPLLVWVDQTPESDLELESRLQKIAAGFSDLAKSEGVRASAATAAKSTPCARDADMRAFVEGPLVALEQTVTEGS